MGSDRVSELEPLCSHMCLSARYASQIDAIVLPCILFYSLHFEEGACVPATQTSLSELLTWLGSVVRYAA